MLETQSLSDIPHYHQIGKKRNVDKWRLIKRRSSKSPGSLELFFNLFLHGDFDVNVPEETFN
jgi:hypothetical protein